MTDDLKALLGRALGDEPPLRIDREAVLEQGRKRLRRKRLIDTGSVVAAVVVAVVGATTLTNLVDSEPERMPPAASSTQPAPPGPQLPITTTTITPGSEPPANAETKSGSPPSTIFASNADQLTALLYATGVVSPDAARSLSGQAGPPQFMTGPDRYVYEADVIEPKAQGFLRVVVGYTSDILDSCVATTPPAAGGDCVIKDRSGVSVTVVHSTSDLGERQTRASAKFRSGVRIAVTVSNTTHAGIKAGKVSPSTPPVLSDDEVCALITKVGLNA